ncbi:hypothetical protein B296_00049070 [Ensete ventricosum]|uniref:RRM domain-containing protein n=1 Tax=Ensete ventricosum TaxID=4639 RepID=A0A426YSC1_ENSVE|nr:hypothetical protein B296_00049070 [Ensete ventricosum]
MALYSACSIYGPVQDVRIPYQQKRMFGFVTFVYPETVKLILAKGNPHFVRDSRVLVKPYKEKGKVSDKYRHSSLLNLHQNHVLLSKDAVQQQQRQPADAEKKCLGVAAPEEKVNSFLGLLHKKAENEEAAGEANLNEDDDFQERSDCRPLVVVARFSSGHGAIGM